MSCRTAVAACLLLCNGLLSGCSSDVPPAAAPSSTSSSAVATPAAAPSAHPGLESFRAARAHASVALPTRIRIPAIGVSSGLESLGKAPDDTIEVPQNPDSAGWYVDGVRPGQTGPAVVLGHVNSARGAAVFYRLDTLRPGEEILVDREDGTTARFEVTRTEQYRKTRFPTEDVYYPTLEAELRLVTCGGPIDSATGRHRDNVIVYATLRA
jgi:sortase (surface protein transpeptidase)